MPNSVVRMMRAPLVGWRRWSSWRTFVVRLSVVGPWACAVEGHFRVAFSLRVVCMVMMEAVFCGERG